MLDAKVETFLQAAALKSYTAAAKALHMTQPAVTQHIHKLEAYYGCRLIDSTGRVVQLTAAGARLYQYLSLERTNERQFRQGLQADMPPLRVGSTLSIADYYLPETIVPHMMDEKMRLSVQVANSEHALEMLLSGELDCAFVEGLFDTGLFEAEVFYQARFLPVAAANHPLAGRTVPLQALHQYPLALREEGSGTRELFESYLYQHNDSVRSFARIMALGSFVLLKELIRQTEAISFMYEAVARQEVQQGKLCFLSIEDYHFVHPLHLIHPKGSGRKAEIQQLFRSLRIADYS